MINLKKEDKKNTKKEKVKKISSKVTNALPFLDIKSDYIIQKDEVMDILEIEGKDIFSLTPIELSRDINIFHAYYKTINVDTKFVSMNFPVNATKQIDYIDYKINKANSEIYKSFLLDKKSELEFLEQNRTNKEYYLFIYAPNEEVLNSVKKTVNRTLSNALNVKILSLLKKKLILFKLNNKNSKISTRSEFSD